MMRPKQNSLPGRALVVLAVSTALLLICKQLTEMKILSGHHWTGSKTALTKIVAVIHVGSWRKALLNRLADPKFLLPVRTVPGPELLEPEVRTLQLYHVHTRESLNITYKRDG